MNADVMMAYQLARTYDDKVSAFRPLPDGTEKTVCENVRGALSRSAQVASPTPPDAEGAVPEAAYRLTLFTEPGVAFQIGDRLAIVRGAQTIAATASDSFCYPSHTITVVEVREVHTGA
ncbi:MAG: hypothetical protein LKJ86_03930 [Oscillibacter sp.]|jgi:hypothetical protein|nr:hypothetical protein [Oscillibacter sp.]